MSHVWTFVIDMALKDIEETRIGKYVMLKHITTFFAILVINYVFLSYRSDGSSSASKIRKNKKRKIGESVIRVNRLLNL